MATADRLHYYRRVLAAYLLPGKLERSRWRTRRILYAIFREGRLLRAS